MSLTAQTLKEIRLSTTLVEVEQIMGRYVTLMDSFDAASIYEELFATEDPEVSVEYCECGRYEGPEHVKAFFAHLQKLLSNPADKYGWMDFTDIATPNVVLSEDGQRCRAMWNTFSPKAKQVTLNDADEATLAAFWQGGKFDVEFKMIAGEWKILHFRMVNYMTAPYDRGWVKQQECRRTPVLWELSPDQAPRYQVYHPDQVYVKGGQYNWGPYLPDTL